MRSWGKHFVFSSVYLTGSGSKWLSHSFYRPQTCDFAIKQHLKAIQTRILDQAEGVKLLQRWCPFFPPGIVALRYSYIALILICCIQQFWDLLNDWGQYLQLFRKLIGSSVGGNPHWLCIISNCQLYNTPVCFPAE